MLKPSDVFHIYSGMLITVTTVQVLFRKSCCWNIMEVFPCHKQKTSSHRYSGHLALTFFLSYFTRFPEPRCRSGVVDVPPGVAFWNGLCLLQREVWLVKSEIYRNERKLVRMQSGIILVWESEGSTFYYRFYGLIGNEWLDINFLL